MTQALKVPYRMNLVDLPGMHVTPPRHDAPSKLSVKMAYGTDTGMMVARRQRGYHSQSHRQDPGPVDKISQHPDDVAFNAAEQGCVMIETHTPQLTGDPDLAKRAYSMRLPGESVDPTKGVNNLWVESPEAAEIERQALAADPD